MAVRLWDTFTYLPGESFLKFTTVISFLAFLLLLTRSFIHFCVTGIAVGPYMYFYMFEMINNIFVSFQ